MPRAACAGCEGPSPCRSWAWLRLLPDQPRGSACGQSLGASNRQRHVVATEPEGVVQGCDVAVRKLAVLTVNDVEGDRWVEVIEVDGGRSQTVVDGQDAEDRLEGSCRTKEVSGHRLGRTHRH